MAAPRSPYDAAGLLSRLSFGFLTPLLRLGYTRPLKRDDIPTLPRATQPRELAPEFDELWAAERAKPKPSLRRAVVALAGTGRLVVAFVLALLSGAAPFAGPLLLREIIRFLGSGEPLYKGVIYVLLLTIVPWLGTLLQSHTFALLSRIGLRMSSAVSYAIFAKSLRLTNASRQTTTSGQIVQLMSTDAQRMVEFAMAVSSLAITPLQIVVCIILLATMLGASVLAGLAVIVLFVPVYAYVGAKMEAAQRTRSDLADTRLKLTNEILGGIRVIKFNAYEASFSKAVDDVRSSELVVLRTLARLLGWLFFCIVLSPTLIFIAAVLVYAWVHSGISVERVFVSSALFNLLRMPLSQAPMLVVDVFMTRNALRRLQKFLLLPEVDVSERLGEARADAARGRVRVEIRQGSFQWAAPAAEPPPAPAKAKAKAKAKTKTKTQAKAKAGAATDATATATAATAATAAATAATAAATAAGAAGAEADADAAPASPASAKESVAQAAAAAAGPTLRNVNLRVCDGELVMIVGPVGSGKSSLIAAMLGEIAPTADSGKGCVFVDGNVAYVPQTAWIMNKTLRDNIMFGFEPDEARYALAIEAAALRADLNMLPAGDATEIGERGINLSGGQKARVSMARAVFADAQIYLLDDPLSAVDAEVGKHIFDRCIMGVLAGKTRVLATHQLHHLPHADHIVVLDGNGAVAESGTLDSLIAANGPFAHMYAEHIGGQGSTAAVATTTASAASRSASAARDLLADSRAADKQQDAPTKGDAAAGVLATEEDREEGKVSWAVYRAYFGAMGGKLFFCVFLALSVLAQLANTGADLWLSLWTSGYVASKSNKRQPLGFYLGILSVFVALYAALTLAKERWFVRGAVESSRSLHARLLERILLAPMAFFDTTPIGRILNRFSKDIGTIDTVLPGQVNLYLLIWLLLGAMCVLVAVTRWEFVFALVPVMLVFRWLQRFYLATALELRRLESISRSPVFSHFSETLVGVECVRAFGLHEVVVGENVKRLESYGLAFLATRFVNFWIQVRLATLGALLVFSCCLPIVMSRSAIRSGSMNLGMAALAVAYAANITDFLRFIVDLSAVVEQYMSSVERVLRFIGMPIEAPHRIAGARPPAAWPSAGAIEFRNVSMRYREGLPLVLNEVSFSIRGGERVGVVGRSGSGKSSLMQVLFRLTELAAGSVHIDGVDVATLGLEDLRSRMAVVPQDPVLFSGTIRSNVDPFGQYSDEQLWRAIEQAQLRADVEALAERLDAPVGEAGSNLSVGQRQLVCLARALLKQPRVLVLDECTASVDMATDARIQRVVREAFAQATTLTIAHRLATIMDSSRILVLNAGRVAEFDTPRALLQRSGGILASLVAQTGEASARHLHAIAEGAVHASVACESYYYEYDASETSFAEAASRASSADDDSW